MTWFAHRAGCPRPVGPRSTSVHALVCAACSQDFVPTCPLCGARANAVGRVEGFVAYDFYWLCPACVARVQAAGAWKDRRALALEARVTALLETHPLLEVEEASATRVVLTGQAHGRAVWLTLRRAPHQGKRDRYVLRVALDAPWDTLSHEELGLLPSLVPLVTEHGVVTDRRRWLRVAFMHLGKRDVLHALAGLCDAAAAHDAAVRDGG